MKIEDVEAFPLCWPEGWPTTPRHKRDDGRQFGSFQQRAGETWRSKVRVTPDAARKSLRDELGRLGAKGVIVSSMLIRLTHTNSKTH